MVPSELRDWIQIAISFVTFLAVLIAGFKVVTIAQEGVQSHERRITDLEQKQNMVETFVTQVVAMGPKIEMLLQEMERMRNRLDRYLDTQSNTRKNAS